MANKSNFMVGDMSTKQRKFFEGVYLWMFLGLFISGIIAYFVASTSLIYYIAGNIWIFWIIAITEILLVLYLSVRVWKMSPSSAKVAFIIYSILNGATLSIIFLVYEVWSIFFVFFIAALMFGMMALVGLKIKKDLSAFGTFFMMALIGLVIAMIANIFLQSSGFDLFIAAVGVLLFSGLTAYDSQRLKKASAVLGGDNLQRASIMGALSLYLDVINLFLMLLRIFGRRRVSN